MLVGGTTEKDLVKRAREGEEGASTTSPRAAEKRKN